MTKSVIVEPDAREEIDVAIEHLAREREGLGFEFWM
jgi:hypothetical protein